MTYDLTLGLAMLGAAFLLAVDVYITFMHRKDFFKPNP